MKAIDIVLKISEKKSTTFFNDIERFYEQWKGMDYDELRYNLSHLLELVNEMDTLWKARRILEKETNNV